MKNAKHIVSIALILVAVLALSMVFAACDKTDNPTPTEQKYDPETRPLILSISTPDGVFNPFFSTSAYDSSVIGQTQIGMLSTDKEGNIVCGEDEPTVVKEYTIKEADDHKSTTYRFLIKNGIKFSDGTPLTIKDVLFNLYVYLDPAYAGSSTIYSTDIIGLQQYRLQSTQADISDDYASSIEDGFVAEASLRVNDLIEFVQLNGTGIKDDDRPSDRWSDEEKVQLNKDFAFVAETFKKELNTDWNNIDVESYKEWGMTAAWQIFLYNDGGYTDLLQKDPEGKLVKDEDGNPQLDVANAESIYQTDILEGLQDLGLEATEENIKNYCIQSVYDSYFPEAGIEKTNVDSFTSVVSYWVTGTTVLDTFTAEAKSAYFQGTDKVVPNISGITTEKVTSFNGKDLGEQYDVLQIRIKDVDPKAIYNFAFTVAPMHYYSTTNYNGKNYIEAFNGTTEFGLEFGDINFMNNVINAPNKVGLPVGAGPYMASNRDKTPATSGKDFFNNNLVYYERNPYFYTLGEGIENAKIKYMRYKVIATDQIITALANNEIDFGDPSATQENIKAVEDAGLGKVTIATSGYGYVGINPRFVPNIAVRRAIMKAFNTSTITENYYKGGLAEIINRPMSKTSWAYPHGATVYKDEDLGLDYSFDQWGTEIENMVIDAGYEKVDGVYQKNIRGFGIDRLDYKFTIAGGSTDHPAYKMFLDAQQILNAHGFDVKVVCSQTALSDLSAGKLEVWAAAWSSTIDPDMYQVYHKDSKASSTSNWGYNQIKAGKNTEAYEEEYEIITLLSEKIDEGRATTDKDERTAIYSQALDLIMRLAVEFPTYQRNDMSAYNKDVLDESTMTPENERSPYNGLLSRIWELNYR